MILEDVVVVSSGITSIQNFVKTEKFKEKEWGKIHLNGESAVV